MDFYQRQQQLKGVYMKKGKKKILNDSAPVVLL